MIFRNVIPYYRHFLEVNVAMMCVTPMDKHGYFNLSGGTGGQLDYVTGAAMAKGGKSFICMKSTYVDHNGQTRSFPSLIRISARNLSQKRRGRRSGFVKALFFPDCFFKSLKCSKWSKLLGPVSNIHLLSVGHRPWHIN